MSNQGMLCECEAYLEAGPAVCDFCEMRDPEYVDLLSQIIDSQCPDPDEEPF